MGSPRTGWAMVAVLTALWGCSGEDEPTGDTDSEPTDTTDVPTAGDDDDTDTPIDSGTTETGGETGDTGGTTSGIVVDCAALPPNPVGASYVMNARAYHGLAFDDAGFLIGYADGNLIKTDYYANFNVFAPIDFPQQFDMAPDGNLYVAVGSGIVQVAPNGGQTTVGTINNAYGVKVGPDGKIYAADNNRMVRIDVVAGTQEDYLPGGSGFSPRVMDWSPDLTKMYVGEFSSRVLVIDLDANFDPIGPPQVLATGFGSYEDGMLVDVCGNIYLSVYGNQATYRITPAGNVSTLIQNSGLQNYAHGMQFGSGIGGWRGDALYVPQPYNGDTVSEIVLEVYHRSWTGGTVINAP